jgi:hypothetical protein
VERFLVVLFLNVDGICPPDQVLLSSFGALQLDCIALAFDGVCEEKGCAPVVAIRQSDGAAHGLALLSHWKQLGTALRRLVANLARVAD